MNPKQRMSPLTALFLSCGLVCTVTIVALATILMMGMVVADQNAGRVLRLAEHAFDNLPEVIEDLPPVISDAFHDRRALDYAEHIEVDVGFVRDARHNAFRPAITVTNTGDEVVALLGLRVAALGERDLPVADWTHVAATPFAFDNDWPGPLLPRSTRHIVLPSYRQLDGAEGETFKAVSEITELRIWLPDEDQPAAEESM